MEIRIAFVDVGKRVMAVTQLAGITVRGALANDKAMAARNLLHRLADPHDDDGAVAVELGSEGSSLTTILRTVDAITDGGKTD